MSDRLFKLLADSSHEIVQGVQTRLRSGGRMEAGMLDERTVLLVGAFIMSTRDDPNLFVDYVREIAEDRRSDGLFLGGIQQVLSLLLERVRVLIVAVAPLEEHLELLGQATSIICQAKVQLARVARPSP